MTETQLPEPRLFAESTLALLQQDPRRYRNFGAYWYLVKEVLKRYYSRDNLALLGDYRDQSVVARMPPHENLRQALAAAVQTYSANAGYNLGRATVIDPEGEEFTLFDPDAGI